jgi:AcrR family transcriptional regulator
MRKSLNEKKESLNSQERLIQAAIALFSEKWYGAVSVAEICRRSGLSNGLFYRYFRDKESIFRVILEMVIARIADSLQGVSGDSVDERLESFATIIFNFSQVNQDIVKVFREGQYRFLEYEQRLRAVYEKGYEAVFGGKPGLADYLFALGGLRFAATRAAFQEVPARLDTLISILKRGIFPDAGFDPEKVFSSSITPIPLELLPDGRERMLKEGKTLVGSQGFYETNIYEISSAAGLSTGAFYTYFESKEAFFAQLIQRVGKEVRRFISMNLSPDLNPLERELRGLWLFVVFLSLDRHCYGLVREAEFVLPRAAKEYYGSFVIGYRSHLTAPAGLDLTTTVEFLLGVAHYLGIEVVFERSPENAKNVISEIGELYRNGISGSGR